MSKIPFDKEKSYYLLVGVGQRATDSEAMAVSADDALYLKRALHAFDLFSDEKIPPLVKEGATRSNILSKLDDLAKKTKNDPADFVIIFFSGHGSKTGDNYHLICRDTQSQDLDKTAIAGSLFVEKLSAIQCNKMLVLLDCCHAKGVGDVVIPFDEKLLLEQKNRVILTACAKSQLSYLSSPVSVFTYALIEALGGKFLNEDDKEVTIFNLAMDVRERVVALSGQVLKAGTKQQPQFNAIQESSTEDFVLARYPLGGPQQIKLFKGEFAALKSYEGKDLNMEAQSEKDWKERDKFSWMQTNTIVNKGNGNYIVQGSTINNGLSEAALKEIIQTVMKANAETVEKFTELLKNQHDAPSGQLLARVENIRSVEAIERGYLEEKLKLLVEKKDFFERELIVTDDAGKQFGLKKKLEEIDREINKSKAALNK